MAKKKPWTAISFLYPEYVKIGEIYDLTVQNGDNCLGQRNIP
jgi:hypothetical protein